MPGYIPITWTQRRSASARKSDETCKKCRCHLKGVSKEAISKCGERIKIFRSKVNGPQPLRKLSKIAQKIKERHCKKGQHFMKNLIK